MFKMNAIIGPAKKLISQPLNYVQFMSGNTPTSQDP